MQIIRVNSLFLTCKSLYGLRQSPRKWNTTFAEAIEDIGFTPILSGPCLYVYGSGDSYVVLSVYMYFCSGFSPLC